MKRVVIFLHQLVRRFVEDRVMDLSAQLAYYFLLSLFPFLIFTVTLLGYFVSVQDVLGLVSQYVPAESMPLIERTLRGALEGKKGGLLSFGLLAILWSSSNATNALIRALNQAYDVKENRPFWQERGIAILITVALIGVILIVLALPVLGNAIKAIIVTLTGDSASFTTIWNVVRWGLSFTVVATVLFFIYYLAPNRRIHHRDVYFGALFATTSWQLASFGFSYALDKFLNFSATYGSLASMIILMIWFYVTGMVIILGGEINATIHAMRKPPHP